MRSVVQNSLSAGVLVALLGVAPQARAVDVCLNADVQSDPFDGNKVVTIMTSPQTLKVTDDGVVMTYSVFQAGVVESPLPAGFSMQWVLANGTKVTFTSPRPVAANPRVYATEYSAGIVTAWHADFPLSAAAVHAIAQSPPTAIRYTLGDQQTLTVGTKRQRLYQRDFACAANHVAPPSVASAPPSPERDQPREPSVPAPAPAADPVDEVVAAADPVDEVVAAAPAPPQPPPATPAPPEPVPPPATSSGPIAPPLPADERARTPAKGIVGPVLWVGAAASGAAAVGLYGSAVVQRGQFLDAPTADGFDRTNRSYWRSVGFAVAGAGFAGVAVAGRF